MQNDRSADATPEVTRRTALKWAGVAGSLFAGAGVVQGQRRRTWPERMYVNYTHNRTWRFVSRRPNEIKRHVERVSAEYQGELWKAGDDEKEVAYYPETTDTSKSGVQHNERYYSASYGSWVRSSTTYNGPGRWYGPYLYFRLDAGEWRLDGPSVYYHARKNRIDSTGKREIRDELETFYGGYIDEPLPNPLPDFSKPDTILSGTAELPYNVSGGKGTESLSCIISSSPFE